MSDVDRYRDYLNTKFLIIGTDINTKNITLSILSPDTSKVVNIVKILSEKLVEHYRVLTSYSIGVVNVQRLAMPIIKIEFDKMKPQHVNVYLGIVNMLSKRFNTIISIENLQGLEYRASKDKVPEYKLLTNKLLENSELVAIIEKPPIKELNVDLMWACTYLTEKYATVLMNPYRTTRICSRCLITENIIRVCKVRGRYVMCDIHGKIDRDENAALNITLLTAKALKMKDYKATLPSTGPSLPLLGVAGAPWRGDEHVASAILRRHGLDVEGRVTVPESENSTRGLYFEDVIRQKINNTKVLTENNPLPPPLSLKMSP